MLLFYNLDESFAVENGDILVEYRWERRWSIVGLSAL